MKKSSLLIWLTVGCVAFTMDWGFFWLLSLAFFVAAIIAGIFFAVYETSTANRSRKDVNFSSFNISTKVPAVSEQTESLQQENENLQNEADEITGIPEVDTQLNLILSYLIRDYVVPWSRKLSATGDNFVLDENLKKKLREAIGNCGTPFRSVDWVEYFTAQLVDDFATHLHLYRMALERVKRRRNKQPSIPENELIEAAFFEAEAELGQPLISREAVSRNQNAETFYFEGVSDVLLSQIVPSAELESGPFRHLARSVLCWAVLRPSLEAISNPDLFNRTVIWLCRGSPIPAEHFTVLARSSTSSDELSAVLERVSFELSRCHALDALTESHELRGQLAALYQLKQVCERRLVELQAPRNKSSAVSEPTNGDESSRSTLTKLPGGSVSVYGLSSVASGEIDEDGVDAESRPSHGSSVFSPSLPVIPQGTQLKTAEPSLLTLNDILSDPNLLNQFSDFAKQRKMYHYLTFLLHAQAFATSFTEALHDILSTFSIPENDPDADAKSVSFPLGGDSISVLSLGETQSLPGALHSCTLPSTTSKSLANMVSNNAGTLFENYLSPRAESTQRLRIDDSLVAHTYNKIEDMISYLQRLDTEQIEALQTIRTDIFSEVKKEVWRKLEHRAMPAFRLELEQQLMAEQSMSVRPSFGSVSSIPMQVETDEESGIMPDRKATSLPVKQCFSSNSHLSARIIDANKVLTNTESFVIYVIHVSSMVYSSVDGDDMHGKIDGLSWDTNRRYKDFAELHSIIKDRFPALASRLHFPKKLLFNNLADDVISKRMRDLGGFLSSLLRECTIDGGVLDRDSATSLKMMLSLFLQAGPWDRCGDTSSASLQLTSSESSSSLRQKRHSHPQTEGVLLENTSNKLFNGAKKLGMMFTAMKAIPDKVDKTVDRLMSFMDEPLNNGGPDFNDEKEAPRLSSDRTSFYKLVLDEVGLPRNESIHSGVGSSSASAVTLDPSLNIPMRILLRLGHEIFDLRSPRHDYLRMQFAGIVSRIVATTYGTSLNKKIVNHVEWLTSRDQVVSYIKSFRDLMWPNGKVAATSLRANLEKATKENEQPTRHPHSQLCARLICKTRMMGVVPDEIRTILSAEATREAVVELFELFQHPALNRRLVLVIFEGLLCRSYPQVNFDEMFRRLHESANIRFGSDLLTKGR